MSTTNHVVYDYEGNTKPVVVPPEKQMWFACQHCGERFMFVVPASGAPIRMVSAVAKAFTAEHRRCKR